MQTSPSHPPVLAFDGAVASSAPATSRVRARLLALWRSAGVWSLGDQAVLSAGTFAVNFLLIPHLPQAIYGIYALVFSVILFLNSLHASLVTYPMTLGAAVADADALRTLAGRSWALTLLMLPALIVGLIIAVGAVDRPGLLPFAVAALLMRQLQETIRRALLAKLRHGQAILGDAISYLGPVAAVWALIWAGQISPEAAFLSIAVCAALGATVQAIQLRLGWACWTELPATARSFWRLGRWVLCTNLVSVGIVYLTPWTLHAFHGSSEVARFSALSQLMGVTNPVLMSMGSLIVPAVAARRAAAGNAAAWRAAIPYAIQAAALLLPYFGFLVLFPGLALRVFGAGSPYAVLQTELRLFVLAYGLFFFANVCGAALNGLGHARATFVATTVGSVGTALIAIPFTIAYGLRGAVWAGLVPIAAQSALTVWMLWRVTDDGRARAEQPETAGLGSMAGAGDHRAAERAAKGKP